MSNRPVGAVLELRRQGLSLREIAEADGRCIPTIRRVLADIGMPPRLTESERFWCKVTRTSTCWLWELALDASGYGLFRRDDSGPQQRAHRISYEWLVGPIPDGLQLDHLCRVRNCVNPAHLEPVTPRENTLRSPLSPSAVNARKKMCDEGHPLGGDNRFPGAGSGRTCRTCQRARQARPTTCPQCGKTMRSDSLGKHMRIHERAAA